MQTEMGLLDFDVFLEEIIKRIQRKLGEGYRVEAVDLAGLNGTVRHSLLVARHGADVRPYINVDGYYQEYVRGMSMDRAVGRIMERALENANINERVKPYLLDWDFVKGRLRGKLINTEKNRAFLQNVPGREYLDLSLVYNIHLTEVADGEDHLVQISNEQLLLWDVDENTLHKELMKSMGGVEHALFADLSRFLAPFSKPVCKEREKNFVTYILGNKDCGYGAVQMCNRKALKEIAEYVGGDFWILPGSVHELIVVPCSLGQENHIEELAQLVREANDGMVPPEQILSYHVYRYGRETGEIMIAA